MYKTAKLALVGDTGVGKTGLGWRLAHGSFKEHSSTHGQHFWKLGHLQSQSAELTCDAVLWDFAGQQDYRIIHSLFLEDVDVALIVFDPTHEQDPLRGVEFWIQQVASGTGGNCKKILIGAREDRGAATLGATELDAFVKLHKIEGGFLSTSAKTGAGIPVLLDRLTTLVNWESIPAMITTDGLEQIKEYVLALKAQATHADILFSAPEMLAKFNQAPGHCAVSIDTLNALLSKTA